MILTLVYVIFLAAIIFLAGRKGTRYLLNFVGSIPYGDKIGHFVLMGILAFLVNLLLRLKTFGVGKVRYLAGSIIVLAVVAAEEISQLFISGRTFDFTDLIADFLGILFFSELARFAGRRYFFYETENQSS